MRRLRELILSGLVFLFVACSELPTVDGEAYTGTLTGTVTALASDRSSVRVGNTQLLLTRSTDVILPSAVSYTKVYLKGKIVSTDGLKMGQKVRLKAKQGFVLEIWLNP